MLPNRSSRLGLCALFAFAAYGQAPAPKQIDIGVQDAPLSDQEKADLGQAIAKHDYAAEKVVIDRAITAHPMSRELQIVAGRVAYLEKHPKDAADALSRAAKIKPLTEDDRLTLALSQQFSGQPDAARAAMLQLTKDFPRNAQYFYLLGRLDSQNQHFEDAAAGFRRAIEINPDLMRAYEELGQVEENLGQTVDARKTYETGAMRNRRQKVPWEWSPLDLGVLLMKEGDLDGADELFQEALKYNPRFGWAHYYLGQLNQKKGRQDKSLAEYRAAVVDMPTLRQAWLALGREYTRLGQQGEADKCLAIFKGLEDRQTARKDKK